MGHGKPLSWAQLRPCHLFLLSQENRGFTGLIDFFPSPSLAVVFHRNHPASLRARTKSCSQQSPFSLGRTFANLGLKQGLRKLSLTIKFPEISNRVFQPIFFPLFCSAPILSSPKNLPFFLAAPGAAAVAPDSCWGVWGVGGSDPPGAASFVPRSPQKASAFQTKFLLCPGACGTLGKVLESGCFWG